MGKTGLELLPASDMTSSRRVNVPIGALTRALELLPASDMPVAVEGLMSLLVHLHVPSSYYLSVI